MPFFIKIVTKTKYKIYNDIHFIHKEINLNNLEKNLERKKNDELRNNSFKYIYQDDLIKYV